jgi:hypothetical protein
MLLEYWNRKVNILSYGYKKENCGVSIIAVIFSIRHPLAANPRALECLTWAMNRDMLRFINSFEVALKSVG